MKMIDVTNSHYTLVTEQLASTDASVVKVYTIGPTTVIYTEAPTHRNIVLVNKVRPIRAKEIDFTIERLFQQSTRDKIEILEAHNFVEMELKCKASKSHI
ncbi:DUF1827 family protein [Aerococcaceae bacterium NML190073]|nr:DUF1827 family protein [Aerococcaceae bacterium NML190073]